MDDLLSGKISPARFTGVRVPWGLYSHRGGKVFMSRIRIPAGQVSAEQLKAIAHCARAYGNGVTHITTRQDIQIHEVKIEDTIKVIEYLKDFELSPRGGGSNTVRNVTACVFSGICPDEVFDTAGYAISLTEYLLAQDSSFNLPRKFKVAFSGCARDCAAIMVNDVGLLAKIKDGQKGFQLFVGGGMGAESLTGHLLEEFISEGELGYCVSAIKNVYYKQGDRRNKHHNRLRFLIKDNGMDVFRKWYQEELRLLKEAEDINLRNIEPVYPQASPWDIPKVEDKEFREFIKYNLIEQKQSGLVIVELRIPLGDLPADKLEKIALLEKDFPCLEYRASQNQNLCLGNVRKTDTHKLFLRLKDILKDFLYPNSLQDVVCCKGALTCNLGLCNSPALTEELEKLIKDNFIAKTVLKKINIRINGCPNACGQHPLGLISLHGMVRRVGGHPIPFYKLLLGGRKGIPDTRLAKDTKLMIPAKSLLLFFKDFLDKINRQIDENTDIHRYFDDKVETLAKEVAQRYAYVPVYSENKDYYIDWGRKEEFSLEGIGPGECGAGVMDMIDTDLTDAKIYLEAARKNNYSVYEIKKVLFFSARALLVVKGADPRDELNALNDFVEKFIRAGLADPKFSQLKEIYVSLSDGSSLKEKEEKFLYAQEYLEHIKEVYKNMDPQFNFPKYAVSASRQEEAKSVESKAVLDLKGVKCPMNYVQAKLYLENLKIGQIVELCLDEGEPIQNVPVSLKNDGQEILEIKKLDGYYKVLVKKWVE